jgi:hypothetical protein
MHVESWSASVCVSTSLFYVAPRVFFVVSFAFKPGTNLAMNFVRLLIAKVRDLTAARHLSGAAINMLVPSRWRHPDRHHARMHDIACLYLLLHNFRN